MGRPRSIPQPHMTHVQWQEQAVELAHVLGWNHLHVRRTIGKNKKWVTSTNRKTHAIPEGTRVEVGCWEPGEDTMGFWMKWHPVATATVTEVIKRITVDMDDDMLGEWTWLVTLTDIDPVNDCDDGQPV